MKKTVFLSLMLVTGLYSGEHRRIVPPLAHIAVKALCKELRQSTQFTQKTMQTLEIIDRLSESDKSFFLKSMQKAIHVRPLKLKQLPAAYSGTLSNAGDRILQMCITHEGKTGSHSRIYSTNPRADGFVQLSSRNNFFNKVLWSPHDDWLACLSGFTEESGTIQLFNTRHGWMQKEIECDSKTKFFFHAGQQYFVTKKANSKTGIIYGSRYKESSNPYIIHYGPDFHKTKKVETGRLCNTIPEQDPTGKWLTLWGVENLLIYRFDENNPEVCTLVGQIPREGPLMSSFTPDGSHLGVLCEGQKVAIYENATGALLAEHTHGTQIKLYETTSLQNKRTIVTSECPDFRLLADGGILLENDSRTRVCNASTLVKGGIFLEHDNDEPGLFEPHEYATSDGKHCIRLEKNAAADKTKIFIKPLNQHLKDQLLIPFKRLGSVKGLIGHIRYTHNPHWIALTDFNGKICAILDLASHKIVSINVKKTSDHFKLAPIKTVTCDGKIQTYSEDRQKSYVYQLPTADLQTAPLNQLMAYSILKRNLKHNQPLCRQSIAQLFGTDNSFLQIFLEKIRAHFSKQGNS